MEEAENVWRVRTPVSGYRIWLITMLRVSISNFASSCEEVGPKAKSLVGHMLAEHTHGRIYVDC